MPICVLNLQRSYKYIMYATKQPTMRINDADLKCKNGCGYFGNADWEGKLQCIYYISFIQSHLLDFINFSCNSHKECVVG